MNRVKRFLLAALVLFLAVATVSAGMGGGGMGGGGCNCGGGGGGGGSVIDPPPGAAFADPAVLADTNPDPGIFEANLEAKPTQVTVNGVKANLFTYNGKLPGPTIRVKQGDIVKLHFKNSLPAGGTNILGHARGYTNIHTHGWHVSPEAPADVAHLVINPGDTFNYEYDMALQEPGTMNFYHPHVHGLVAEQYWAGLAGTLITEDPVDSPVAGFETHVMLIKDITLSGSSPAPYSMMRDYMMGKEGNTIMVNGQVNPVLSIRPGQVQRWRIVNACNARFLRLALQGHSMYLVGTDGGLLDKPYAEPEILLSPGERIDILVKGGTAGTYKFQSLPYNRGGMGNMASTSPTITLLTLASKGTAASDAIPAVINPDAMRMGMDTGMLTKRTMTLSMMGGAGYINGQTWDVSPYTIMSEVGTHEVWEIVNPSMMDHPFHQHVNAAQVLSVEGGDANYARLYTTTPSMKDTVLVPRGGKVTLLVPIMDYTGMTMFHCHIVEHEDIGMMGMWHIMKGEMPPMPK